MSDSSRFNSPSRKSRFRAQGRGRPSASYPAGQEAAGDSPAEDAAAEDMVESDHDLYAEMPVEEMPGEPSLEEAPASEQDALPAGLRLTRDPDRVVARQGLSTGAVVGIALATLIAGGAGGYFFGHSRAKAAAAAQPVHVDAVKNMTPLAMSNELQAAVEAAFTDTKQARYPEARQRFEALYKEHPEWPSMEIEAARAALYQRDMQGTQTLLAIATRDRPLADATLLTALLHLTAQEYDAADDSFASAVATDPARADIYYFWGENLRREGKPQQAAEKFKSALVRNQYENVEPLYLLKYWLSLVQSEQEESSGEGAKIDAILATPHPSSAALFAGAARDVKLGKYKEAADLIGKAQLVTDPTVFSVILRDPTFLEANMRPEFAPFYK